jgi:hypothetical protein
MSNSKKITWETSETIKSEDGRIINQSSTKTARVEKEPNYVKLYLDDICILNNLPKTSSSILNELLVYANYNNEISLSVGVKNKIVKKLEITKGHLDNTLTKLTKSEILKNIDRGLYMLSPFIFGRGNWLDIKKIRAIWTYGKNGRELETELQFNTFKTEPDLIELVDIHSAGSVFENDRNTYKVVDSPIREYKINKKVS